MRLKRIGHDLYEGQDGLYYNGDGEVKSLVDKIFASEKLEEAIDENPSIPEAS